MQQDERDDGAGGEAADGAVILPLPPPGRRRDQARPAYRSAAQAARHGDDQYAGADTPEWQQREDAGR